MDFHQANDLTNFINVDKLRIGGLDTEYCLYLIRDLAKDTSDPWAESILNILESISNIDFEKLNRVQTPPKQNEGIVIDVIYEILNLISTEYPKYLSKCINIDKNLSLSNSWFSKYPDSRKRDFKAFRAKSDVSFAAQKLAGHSDR